MITRMALLAVVAALTLGGPANAAWRVVGPGIAVGEARAGNASLAAECLGDGLVLAVYEKSWPFDREATLDIVVDGTAFPVRQHGSGDRIVLSDATSESGNPDTSPALRAALKSGREARLDGPVVSHIAPEDISFGLLGSQAAVTTVERFCQ